MIKNEKAPVEAGAYASNHLKAPVTTPTVSITGASPLSNLLTRLDMVKALPAKNHAESYAALCTAHPDKTPSLCIDLTHDGRILLFCRAGCGGAEVLAAVGLSLADLYPDNDYKRPPGYTSKEIDYALTVAQVAEKYRRIRRKPKSTDLDLIN